MDQGVSKPDGSPGTPVPKKALIKLSDMKPGALAHLFRDGSIGPVPDDGYVPDDDFEPTLSMEEMTAAWRRGADFFSAPPPAAGSLAFGALENPEKLADRIRTIREMLRAEYVPTPPQYGEELTPRQSAIRYVDMWAEWLIVDLESGYRREETVAQALGLGAALMFLAVSKPRTGAQGNAAQDANAGAVLRATVAPEVDEMVNRIATAAAGVVTTAARAAARLGVRDGYRERDKKTRKDRSRRRAGQYDGDNWAAALEKFETLVAKQKERRGGRKKLVGELMREARQALRMTKVTDDRFRAKIYEMIRQRESRGGGS